MNDKLAAAAMRKTGSRGLAVVPVSLAAFLFGGAAMAAGPFGVLPGSWVGNGTVSLDGGTKERMQCRAQYVVKNDDNNFQMALRCSSPSYKFEVNAYVDHDSGNLSGYWSEDVNNVRGGVSGSVSGNHIQSMLRGTGFAASMDINTAGTSQTVTVTPVDTDTRVQKVAVTMKKG